VDRPHLLLVKSTARRCQDVVGIGAGPHLHDAVDRTDQADQLTNRLVVEADGEDVSARRLAPATIEARCSNACRCACC
jgi:hypothetical protein